jgi:hypothetical protein
MATKRKYYSQPIWYEMGTMRSQCRALIPKEPLEFDGLTMDDVMHAERGVTIGCVISRGCNERAKLPFKLVAAPQITARTAFFPTKLDPKTGQPCEGYKYHHEYRHITDANDDGSLKEAVKERRILGKKLTFTPAPVKDNPRVRGSGTPRGNKGTRGEIAEPRARVRGSALRARKAGLITKPVYEDMKRRHPEEV